MFIVAQYDPSLDFFLTLSNPVVIKNSVINRFTAGTLIIKNRSYFDLLFQATDGRSFYVEQEKDRAFYFSDLQTWNFTYTPLPKGNMNNVAGVVALPYQLVTIELFLEDEEVIERYPTSNLVFTPPSIEVISRVGELFMVSSGVLNSPASGNMPFSLFITGNGQLATTVTVLSVKLSVDHVVQVDMKSTGTAPTFSATDVPQSTNPAASVTPLTSVLHQNSNVAKITGHSMNASTVPANSIYEFVAPGVLTLPTLDYPTPAFGILGGVVFYMTPTVATAYAWTALFKEEPA